MKFVKSEFTRNVLTLMTGTTIAQAIPIAISPILTRLYTPEDFGVFALFLSITSILGSIVNARYELAIMLPRKDEDAINIVALGIIIAFSFSFFIFIIILIFHNKIIKLLNNQEISIWLYFVPLVILLTGLYNVLNYWNNRKKQYKDLAKATIIKSIVTATVQLSMGFMKSGASGLISGQLLSQIFANTKLLKNIMKDKGLIASISKTKIIAVAKRYKDFPKFSMWAALANISSTQLTNILISIFFNVYTLGYYALVQRVLSVPSGFIGSAIGQVFFQEASKEKNETGNAINSFNSTLKKLLIIGFSFFGILFFMVEDLFAFVFGEEWRIAGKYAKIMIPMFLVSFIVSPLTLMNQINLKNKLGMLWQFGLLILYVSIIIISNALHIGFENFLYLITIIISCYYIYFLYLINKHVKAVND